MAQDKLEIVVTAKDDASGTLEGIAGHVNDIQNTLAAEALQRVGEAAGRVFQETTALIGDFVKEAGDAQLVGAQLDAQIKAMGA